MEHHLGIFDGYCISQLRAVSEVTWQI